MRWCCKLPVPGRPTILITVGQGPTALAAGAGWIVWTFFPSSVISLFLLPLSRGGGGGGGGARYRLKYCLKGPLNPHQPTNQPNRSYFHVSKGVRAIEVVL